MTSWSRNYIVVPDIRQSQDINIVLCTEHSFYVRVFPYGLMAENVSSQFQENLMIFSVTSHLNSISHDLPLFTFHLTMASKFQRTQSFVISSGMKLTICGAFPWSMAMAPCWCLLSSHTPMVPSSPRFYSLCCFLLWHFVKTRESPLGQLAFSLFQLICELGLGDRKTSLCFVAERAVVRLPGSSGTQTPRSHLSSLALVPAYLRFLSLLQSPSSHFCRSKFCTMPTGTIII